MKKNVFVIALIAMAMGSWAFVPRANGYATPNGGTYFIEPDSVFVKVAASSNMMEIELGNLAVQKATNQRVKDFGAMMVAEHTKATQELSTLARSKNMNLPPAMLRQHSRQVDFLRNVSGAEFDQLYMRVMVEEHREDVDEFEDASKKAKDADLRGWAGRMLPHLKMHLDTARSLRNFVRNNYNYMASDAANMQTTGTPTSGDAGTNLNTTQPNEATMDHSNMDTNNAATKANKKETKKTNTKKEDNKQGSGGNNL